HKADGKGYAAMKTPDFTSKEWQTSRTDEQLIETVSKGKAPMPAFEKQLKPEEIKALVRDVVRKFVEKFPNHLRQYGKAWRVSRLFVFSENELRWRASVNYQRARAREPSTLPSLLK